MAWGAVGLYLSEQSEKAGVMRASEEDKAAIERLIPKVRFVDAVGEREGGSGGSASGSGVGSTSSNNSTAK